MVRALILLALGLLVCDAQQQTMLHTSGPSVPTVGSIVSVATDTNTPSTVAVTMQGNQNALRIWSGEQPVSVPFFDLYVSTNGGAAYAVRLYRWQGRILQVGTNSTVALATTNGQTLKVSAMTVPAALPSPAGTTNTFALSVAGPPLYTPTNGNLILPANNSCLSMLCSNETTVFLYEHDGSQWSPARWVRLETNTPTTVQCTYPRIALANYDGAFVTMTAPAGSTFITNQENEHLTFPLTGTTHSCSNVSEFQTAITNAVSGDHIVLQDGTYALTVNPAMQSFASNNAAGHIGLEGITIRSASGNRDAVIISGSATNTGIWTLQQTNTVAGGFKDVTFNQDGRYASFNIAGGAWRFENVRWTGVASNGMDGFVMNTQAGAGGSLNVVALRCQSDTCAQDCFDGNGIAGNSNNLTSVLRLINCVGYQGGPNSSDQIVTSHNGLPLEIYGGQFHDATTSVIASDAITTPVYVHWATVYSTNRGANIHTGGNTFGTWQSGSNTAQVANSLFSRWSEVSRDAIGNNYWVAHSRFYPGTLRAFHSSIGGSAFIGNIVHGGSSDEVRLGDYSSGSTARVWVMGNTVIGATTAFSLLATQFPMWFTNNAAKTSGTGVNVTPSTTVTNVFRDYNVLDPAITGYTAWTNDVVNADAALDARYFPTASGNADQTGCAALGYVGDSDPFGFVWVYKLGASSKGARSIPAIIAGAQVYPDVW